MTYICCGCLQLKLFANLCCIMFEFLCSGLIPPVALRHFGAANSVRQRVPACWLPSGKLT